MTTIRRKSWFRWDVGLGLFLTLCGVMLALWDRQQTPTKPIGGGAAALRAAP